MSAVRLTPAMHHYLLDVRNDSKDAQYVVSSAVIHAADDLGYTTASGDARSGSVLTDLGRAALDANESEVRRG